MFNIDDKVGEIAKRFPKSMELFFKYQIDFCCGGNRTLSKALEEKGINQKEFLSKLNKLYTISKEKVQKGDVNWENKSLSEIIDYIVNKHHAFLQEKLPEISELVTKILRVHGHNHGEVLQQVHRLFNNLKIELEQHLIKEEEVLFPAIKQYGENPEKTTLDEVFSVINELEEEHEGAGDILKELRAVTKEYKVPEDGCQTYELTYNLLEELEKDLFNHIHLENNVLFPKLEKVRT